MIALNDIDTTTLIIILTILIMVSAFFSSSETAMMSINKYRLRLLAKNGHRGAEKTYYMLKHVDKLLGIILIGNTLVNFIATTLFTILGFRLLGETGIAIAPILATILFLIFAEVSPKTIAAHYPEKIALTNAHILEPLMKIFSPLIFTVNAICNFLLKPFKIDVTQFLQQDINMEELRLIVSHNLMLSSHRQKMLLAIMDLESYSVSDIMIPLSDTTGINLNDSIDTILQILTNSRFTRLIIYKENKNEILGVLHLKNAMNLLRLNQELTKSDILKASTPPYFIPIHTSLHTQLTNFQKQRKRFAIAVNEYGDAKGIVTLEIILEEIVGDYSTHISKNIAIPDKEGFFYLEGHLLIRDVNKKFGFKLPTNGPKTLNGLILEAVEIIPKHNISLKIGPYVLETLKIKVNKIDTLRIKRLEEKSADTFLETE